MPFRSELILVMVGAITMWVFPSFSTHGMDRLYYGIRHVDQRLFNGRSNSRDVERVLQRADRNVDTAVIAEGFLASVTVNRTVWPVQRFQVLHSR